MAKKSSKKKELTPKEILKPKYLPLNLKSSSLVAIGFILAAFILYGQSMGFNYVLDDAIVFTGNNHVKNGLEGIGDILSNDSFHGYFGEQKDLVQGARFRPLSLITFALEYELFGSSSAVSHFINTLLYSLTAFLCFLTLRRLFHKDDNHIKIFYSIAFLSSLIYLCHPIHVEAVANVKGRDEILSMLFSMWTLLATLRYVDTEKMSALISIPVLFMLGLVAKENTITFLAIVPFAILIFRKESRKKIILIFSLLFAVALIYLLWRYQVIGYLLGDEPSDDLMNNSFVGMNVLQRYATISYTLLLYLKLCIFPHPLTHDYYPYHIPIMDFGDWQVWLSIMIHLILGGLIIYWIKKRPKISFSLFYYIAALSIVSNIVISIGTFMNERFMFAASLGICIILALCISWLASKFPDKRKIVFTSLAAILLGLYSVKTITRVPAWESELSLNNTAIKVSKNSARANSFMATALFNEYKKTNDRARQKQLLERALPHARKATQIHPTYYNGYLMQVGVAAELYKQNGNLDALLKDFKPAMINKPQISFLEEFLNYINDREDRNKMMSFYKDVCITNMIDKRQDYKWSIKYLSMAYKMDPNDPEIRRGLRKAYLGLGNVEYANRFR